MSVEGKSPLIGGGNGGTAAGFVPTQALQVPAVETARPITEVLQAAKVETTKVWVSQGGFAMEVTVPKLSGEALQQQQRAQQERVWAQAERLNADYTKRRALTHGVAPV